ncbi:MAG: Rha family transcriptional regulator [Acidovorax sp.]|jgi:Rha family phage regulatory protein|nr:Rha family transcriptional regulator [Comamonas sp.]MDR2326435.1 Rha family transcriptional regulator [Acidovorax sp.]
MQEITELVALSDGKPMTSSRKMAKRFNKRHANVLRLFQTRIQGRHSPEFIELNFELVDYIDAKGEARQEILMTKNGFIAMATKLSGAEEWQERFIAAFDRLSEQLERMAFTLWNRRLALETRDATSLAKASIGSHLMLDRKKELPAIKAERDFLAAEMQPSLPLH